MTEIRRVISEIKGKCERMNQEIQRVQEDTNVRIEAVQINQGNITRVQAEMGERLEGIDTNINQIKGQTTTHEEKLEGFRLHLQEEINSWSDRKCLSSHTSCNEH